MLKKSSVMFALLSVLTFTAAMLTGCGPSESNTGKVNKIKILSGSNQFTLPGEEFPRDLVVNAEGKPEEGFE